jgi:hypothetical protein
MEEKKAKRKKEEKEGPREGERFKEVDKRLERVSNGARIIKHRTNPAYSPFF